MAPVCASPDWIACVDAKASRMKYLLLPMLLLQSGCSVLAVADAAVSVAATTVQVGAKAVGAVVDAVVPDKGKDKDKEKK
jgi:hypothetical protein